MSKNFCHLDIQTQVQQAHIAAESAILIGLEGYAADRDTNNVLDMAAELAGVQDWIQKRFEHDDADDLIIVNLVHAARAIGLVERLRLRPELFTKGVA